MPAVSWFLPVLPCAIMLNLYFVDKKSMEPRLSLVAQTVVVWHVSRQKSRDCRNVRFSRHTKLVTDSSRWLFLMDECEKRLALARGGKGTFGSVNQKE